MRLLIVTPEFAPHAGGGIIRYYGGLVPALARAGLDVTVLVAAPFAEPFDDYPLPDGGRVVCVARSAIVSAEEHLPQLSAAPEFRRWMAAAWAAHRAAAAAGPFDVIETTDFGLGFVPFLVEPPGTPVIVRCHGSLGQISVHEPRQAPFELDRALARLAEAVLLPYAADLQTYGQANALEWSSRFNRSVTVVRPGVSASGEPAADRDGGALTVGRVQSWKGPEVLCRALRLVPRDACPTVRWIGRNTRTAEGGASLAAYLRQEYPDVWGARIDWTGPRSFDEVSGFVARASVVIIPSTWDVFNFTAVEAMAAGKVVVCSRGAGASDVIVSGENGFLCDAGNEDSLAEAIVTAATLSVGEAARLGRAAIDTVRCELHPDRSAEAHAARYRAVGEPGARPPDWVRQFFSPNQHARPNLAFLDQMSISSVAAYLGGRLRRRLGEGGRSEPE